MIPFLHRTLVSFSVEGDTLTYEAVSSRISERRDTLSMLNFAVLDISQGKRQKARR